MMYALRRWFLLRTAEVLVTKFIEPTESSEFLPQARERHTYHIKIGALNSRDIAAGPALNRVSARFVVRLVSGQIARNFFRRNFGKLDLRGFHKTATLSIGKTNQHDTGNNRMRATGEQLQSSPGVLRGTRFADDLAVQRNYSVGADDNCRTYRTCGDKFRFCASQTVYVIVWGFARNRRFIDSGRNNRKGHACVTKNFGSTR